MVTIRTKWLLPLTGIGVGVEAPDLAWHTDHEFGAAIIKLH